MPEPSVPPPLRVQNPAGTFSQIPVFELEVSGATLTRISPIRTRLLIDSGAAPVGSQYVTMALDPTLTAERVLTASTGLGLADGGANGNVTLSVNTNVRDKALGFFFSGALATTSLAVNARVYIPFTVQLLQVRLASQTAPTGESIITNPLQYNAALSASTALFTSTNRPMVVGGSNVGSDNATIAIASLYSGSWLGVNVDAVGTTNAGSNLTVTFITRGS